MSLRDGDRKGNGWDDKVLSGETEREVSRMQGKALALGVILGGGGEDVNVRGNGAARGLGLLAVFFGLSVSERRGKGAARGLDLHEGFPVLSALVRSGKGAACGLILSLAPAVIGLFVC